MLVSSSFRDVKESKRVVTSLRQSVAAFRGMVEGTYGVYRATPEGKILMANPALATILGYESFKELLSLNLAADVFLAGEYSSQLFDQPGRRKQFTQLQSRWRRRDSRVIPVELTGRPISDEAGNVMYFEVIAQDVSQQRSAENRLRHVQKMEAIGRLAGGIAHDFNNVLGVITGYSEMLLDKLGADVKLSGLVTQILEASQRASTLTRQLLAFSRQQVLDPRVIDVKEHLKGIQSLLRRVLGEDIRLTVDTGGRSVRLRVDPTQLEQVIMNLVVNARDAMPSGGNLSIEVSEAQMDAEYCQHNPDARPGTYVCIAVTDTGCGMSQEIMTRIFEPFFTTKESGKGTGLGLATVYGIVKQSLGYLTVYSEVGHGTTFKVYLPLTEEAAQSREIESLCETVPGGSEIILLVEDEESLREVTRNYLSGKGYTVLAAAEAEEAVALAGACTGPLDLLLTDVILPGSSGVQLAQRLSARQPKMRILYVSGYTADTIVHHGGHDPNFAFLSKPFGLATLAKKIRAVLDAEPSALAQTAKNTSE